MAKQEAVTVRVDKPVKDRFTAIATRRGLTRGELLRRLMMEEIRKERSS